MFLVAVERGANGLERGGPGFLFPLLILTLGALTFMWLRRRRHGHMREHFATASPKQTLADRFARGEIDQAEYAHRRAVLDGDDDIPPAPASPAPPVPPTDGAVDDSADDA